MAWLDFQLSIEMAASFFFRLIIFFIIFLKRALKPSRPIYRFEGYAGLLAFSVNMCTSKWDYVISHIDFFTFNKSFLFTV